MKMGPLGHLKKLPPAMVIRLQYLRGTTSPSLPTTICKRYKTQNSGQEYELNETDVPDGIETDA